MANQETTGIKRIINATFYSMSGFRTAFLNEAAFSQECFLAMILIPAGFWFGENGVEKALLAGVVLIVLIDELLNTGIEAVVDRIGFEKHELSGIAKDTGSAAVFTSLTLVVMVWGMILFF